MRNLHNDIPGEPPFTSSQCTYHRDRNGIAVPRSKPELPAWIKAKYRMPIDPRRADCDGLFCQPLQENGTMLSDGEIRKIFGWILISFVFGLVVGIYFMF